MPACLVEGEEPADFVGAGLSSVFAQLERLSQWECVEGLPRGVRGRFCADAGAAVEDFADALSSAGVVCRHLVERSGVVGQPFEELGLVGADHVHFGFEDIVDSDSDIAPERDNVAEIVVPSGEHGHAVEVASVRAEHRDGQHVGGVHHQLRGVAMVAVVVDGSVEEDEVGAVSGFADGSDAADDGLGGGKVDDHFAVVDSEGLVMGADVRRGGLAFAEASMG